MKVRPKRLGDGMVVALLTLALLAPGLRAQSAQQPPTRDRSAEPSEFASIRQWFGELDDDVILGVVERPDVRTLGMYEFQMVVKGVTPGTVIHFQVMRQGQVIRVPVAPDPRPLEADVNMQELSFRRQRKADDYWEKAFAPVVKEAVG